MTQLNHVILSYILTFLELDKISNMLEESTHLNKIDKDIIIGGISVTRKNKFKLIKGKINNYQKRCGECYKALNDDWCLVIGYDSCDKCLSYNNLNIEVCNKCCSKRLEKKITRGMVDTMYCDKCNKVILYLGINILS